jgi:hypothetical protein
MSSAIKRKQLIDEVENNNFNITIIFYAVGKNSRWFSNIRSSEWQLNWPGQKQ